MRSAQPCLCPGCNEVCSVTGADVFKIEHIRGTLETITPGPLVMILMSGHHDVPASPGVLLRHELAWRREAGKKVTQCSHSRSSQEAHSSLIDSTPTNHLNFQWTRTSTHCTAIFRPVLDSSLKPNFSLPRCSISSALHICDGVSCHQPRCLKRTFFSPHYCTGLSKTESPQKGESFIVPDRLSLTHRDNDSQSINAETKIRNSTKN